MPRGKADLPRGKLAEDPPWRWERHGILLPIVAASIERGAGACCYDAATVDKWRDIGRTTAWKDYARKTALSAELIKLAEQVS